MIKFEELDEARKLIGIGQRASIKEIKSAFRSISLKYHPDTCKKKSDVCEKMMRKLNKAYKIILSYCDAYEYSFSREDFENANPEYILRERFKDDWLSS